MAITLGGITLPAGLIWTQRFQTSNVVQQQRRFLNGNMDIVEAQITRGQPILLEATTTEGWGGFTKTVVDSIIALSNNVGVSYELSYHGETHDVKFDHSEGAAVQVQPLVHTQNIPADWYFIGKIYLITV